MPATSAGLAASNAPSRSATRTRMPTSRPTTPKSKVTRSTTVSSCPETMSPRKIRARPPACSTPERRERVDADGVGQAQLEDHLAGDDLQGLAHLGGDVVPHLGHVTGVVEVAAAVVGHGLEQRLVEVRPDAERAGGHAPSAEVVGEPGELRRVGHAAVGEAVGEEQDAVDALGLEARGRLLAAGEPARVEVRAVARQDRGQAPGRLAAGLGRGRRAGHHDLHLVVVGDDREAVLGLEAVDGLEGRLLGERELVVPAHGARAVEHEGEVDGRPAAGRVGRDGRRRDLDEQEALAAPVGADEAAVGADDEARVDQAVGAVGLGHDGPPSRCGLEARMGRVSGVWCRRGTRAADGAGRAAAGVVRGWVGCAGSPRRATCPRTAPGRSAPAGPRACWSGGPGAAGRAAPRPGR